MVVVVMVAMVAAIAMVVVLDQEPPAAEDAVVVLDQPAMGLVAQHRGDALHDARFQVGEGVEHGGQEHVAGHAAESVELYVRAHRQMAYTPPPCPASS
jgi:hypothetical protein